MHQFSEAAGRTVAADLNNVFTSLDASILDAGRLTVSLMEGNVQARVAPARAQRVLDKVAASLAGVVQSRKDMVAAHQTLTALKQDSNLDVVDIGCTEGPLWDGRVATAQSDGAETA